jgi:hypothetical protein
LSESIELRCFDNVGFFCGCFEAWKYEVGNMDYSFKQGVGVVERLLTGKDEKTANSRA